MRDGDLWASTSEDRVRRSGRTEQLHRGVWAPSTDADSAERRARAALLACPDAVLIEEWAAWALAPRRLFPPKGPVRLGLPPDAYAETRDGLVLRRLKLPASECAEVNGFRVTIGDRAAVDVLCAHRRLGRYGVIEIVDQLLNTRQTSLEAIEARLAVSHQRGVARARVLHSELEAKAESTGETRLRLTIVDQGLPRPEAQWIIRDELGGFLACCDLGYGDVRIGFEYFGAVHKEQMAKDWNRQNVVSIDDALVLTFTAEHLRNPSLVGTLARNALASRQPRSSAG